MNVVHSKEFKPLLIVFPNCFHYLSQCAMITNTFGKPYNNVFYLTFGDNTKVLRTMPWESDPKYVFTFSLFLFSALVQHPCNSVSQHSSALDMCTGKFLRVCFQIISSISPSMLLWFHLSSLSDGQEKQWGNCCLGREMGVVLQEGTLHVFLNRVGI